MKQRLLSFALALGLVLSTGAVYASCTTTTIMIDGRMTICTTGCSNGNCNVTCY